MVAKQNRKRRAANRERVREHNRKRSAANPEKVSDEGSQTAWLDAQEWSMTRGIGKKGLCMLCDKPLKSKNKAHADHDHDTGLPRGLLCFRCNTLEGLIRKAPPDFLERLAHYIQFYREHRRA